MRSILVGLACLTFILAVPQLYAEKVSEVTKEKLRQQVELTGTVESFQASRSERAPNSFKLKDDSGTIRVCIWPDVFEKVQGRDALKPGAKVSLKGSVAEFRDAIEVHVKAPEDIKIEGAAATATAPATSSSAPSSASNAPAPAAAASSSDVTPISSITNSVIGQNFTIQGEVVSARAPSSDRAPYILKVKDATGSIDVVFWKDFAEKLSDGQKVNTGDKVRVTGKLGEFRGSLQLKPESPSDIKTPKTDPALFKDSQTQKPAEQPQGAAQRVPLSQIASADPGQIVTVSGKVVTVEKMRLGQKVVLSDGNSRATVLIWSTASGLKPAIERLRGGEQLQLRARVDRLDSTPILVVTKPEEILYIG
jgi:DNA/RNA endonuclease YhcR with UshA esterase domain